MHIIYTCKKCGRAYNIKQLKNTKTMEGNLIIIYEIQCPQCFLNDFLLTYEKYKKEVAEK